MVFAIGFFVCRPEDVAEVLWEAYYRPLASDVADLELPPLTPAGA